jgi:hypothetical protein
LAGLKAWLSRTIAVTLDEALAEWSVKANTLLSEAAGNAESRALGGTKGRGSRKIARDAWTKEKRSPGA